ncbi:glycerophosphodiester phosphodiesterase family protein [Motiliproteus sp.]|uniref:glycerophosphodiester phosphodiesterase family protein n=1 Tax=Motiliproteus sp. TaxID=1898955 RepID=UPI003BAA302C
MAEFQLIAHRGYPSRYPENTLVGFEQSIAVGARYLEADLQFSAQATPYLFHDRELDRLCGRAGQIHRLSDAQLSHCHPGYPSRFGDRFSDIDLLSLEAMVELLRRHPQVSLFLELKRTMTQVLSPSKSVARILPLLQEVRPQVILISFSIQLLQQARRQGWQRVAPVLTRWYQLAHREVLALEPEWVFLNRLRVPLGVGPGPKQGVPIVLYESSDIAQARQLADRGFHWLETDSIGEMLAAQRKSYEPEPYPRGGV